MKRIELILLAAISIAIAFNLNSCGEVGGDDGGGSSSTGGGVSSSTEPEVITAECDADVDTLFQFCFTLKGSNGRDSIALFDKCNSGKFDPTKNFCYNRSLYFKCDGRDYNVNTEFCFRLEEDGEDPEKGRVSLRCGNNPVDPDYEFCFNGNILPNCGRDISKEIKGKPYNPNERFCAPNKSGTGDSLYFKCGDKDYVPGKQFCDRLTIVDLCDGKSYDIKESFCFDKKLYTKNGCSTKADFCDSNGNYKECGKEKYDVDLQFCVKEDNGEDHPEDLCEGLPYNFGEEFCPKYGGGATHYCVKIIPSGDPSVPPTRIPQKYEPTTHKCVDSEIVPLPSPQKCDLLDTLIYPTATHFCCFGKYYSKTGGSFCFNEVLYSTCGRPYGDGTPYNPNDSICYDEHNILKPKCHLDGSKRGSCVHNGLLKCKQLGDTDDYIIDPLPAMTCQDNGAITGTITDAVTARTYQVAQIKYQLWLAEDVIQATATQGVYDTLFKWESAKSLCPEPFEVPTQSDWDKLIEYAGGDNIAGGRLKSTTGWKHNINGSPSDNIYDLNGNGMDDYGFNAKPNGYYEGYIDSVGIRDRGFRAMWWIYGGSSEDYKTIISPDPKIRQGIFQPSGAYKAALRCVRNYKDN